MTNITWNDPLLICSLMGSIFIIVGEIIKYRREEVSKKSWALLSLALIGVLATIYTALMQNKNGNIKDGQLQIDQRRRDSTISFKVDSITGSNRMKLFNDISVAFKRQDLKLDTLTKTVFRLTDSSNKTTNIFPVVDPTFQIDSIIIDSQSTTTAHVTVRFASMSAASTNFKIKVFVLTKDVSGNERVSLIENFFSKSERIAADLWIEKGFPILTAEISRLFIYVQGSYTAYKNNTPYFIDQLYMFKPEIKQVGVVKGEIANIYVNKIKRYYPDAQKRIK